MDDELKHYLMAMEERLKTHVDQRVEASEHRLEGRLMTHVDERFEAFEHKLVEKMRDIQSELLRGFRVFSGAQVIRLRKLEADQSNLDASLANRVEAVENRLL
jgi:uncharacterized protein (UPF0335 family)